MTDQTTQTEIENLIQHAASRNLSSEGLARLLAITLGGLIRECANSERDKHAALEALLAVVRANAGIDDESGQQVH